MTLTLETPTEIKRSDYLAFIRSLGIDPYQARHIKFTPRDITVEMKTKGDDGRDIVDPTDDTRILTYTVKIQVTDG